MRGVCRRLRLTVMVSMMLLIVLLMVITAWTFPIPTGTNAGAQIRDSNRCTKPSFTTTADSFDILVAIQSLRRQKENAGVHMQDRAPVWRLQSETRINEGSGLF